jgi:hypothetical protein
MALRLTRVADRAGVRRIGLLQAAHRVAMEPRHRLLDDDHDPRYLHPGRTFLIALNDGGLRDESLLATGLLLDTLDPSVEPARAAVTAEDDPEVAQAWARARALPRPWDDDLVERLVTAPPGEQTVVLSEWLDQLRHLRLWGDPSTVMRAMDMTREAYLPVAERLGGTLCRRFRWWIRRVGPGVNSLS